MWGSPCSPARWAFSLPFSSGFEGGAEGSKPQGLASHPYKRSRLGVCLGKGRLRTGHHRTLRAPSSRASRSQWPAIRRSDCVNPRRRSSSISNPMVGRSPTTRIASAGHWWRQWPLNARCLRTAAVRPSGDTRQPRKSAFTISTFEHRSTRSPVRARLVARAGFDLLPHPPAHAGKACPPASVLISL